MGNLTTLEDVFLRSDDDSFSFNQTVTLDPNTLDEDENLLIPSKEKSHQITIDLKEHELDGLSRSDFSNFGEAILHIPTLNDITQLIEEHKKNQSQLRLQITNKETIRKYSNPDVWFFGNIVYDSEVEKGHKSYETNLRKKVKTELQNSRNIANSLILEAKNYLTIVKKKKDKKKLKETIKKAESWKINYQKKIKPLNDEVSNILKNMTSMVSNYGKIQSTINEYFKQDDLSNMAPYFDPIVDNIKKYRDFHARVAAIRCSPELSMNSDLNYVKDLRSIAEKLDSVTLFYDVRHDGNTNITSFKKDFPDKDFYSLYITLKIRMGDLEFTETKENMDILKKNLILGYNEENIPEVIIFYSTLANKENKSITNEFLHLKEQLVFSDNSYPESESFKNSFEEYLIAQGYKGITSDEELEGFEKTTIYYTEKNNINKDVYLKKF